MAGGSAAKGQAGTKSIIELVREATGASEEDIKQSLQEHGGDVNATVNALLDDGQFSSVINKKTKKKQKEEERRSLQQREASAAALGKVLEVPRRQSSGGQRDRGVRPRDATRSARGRGGQPRMQPTNDAVDVGAVPEEALNPTPASEPDAHSPLPPAPASLQLPLLQQQQLQQQPPVASVASGAPAKPWGAPTEGSLSMAERLRQQPPPPQQQQLQQQQQPQQVMPQVAVEDASPELSAPPTQPAPSQHSLSNGVEASHVQPSLPPQQSEAQKQLLQQEQQQEQQQLVSPSLMQQQPHSVSQLHHQLPPLLQQQRTSLEQCVAARSQESIDNRDVTAPRQGSSAGVGAPDNLHMSWGAAPDTTQPPLHPALSHGMASGRAMSSNIQAGNSVGSSVGGTHSGGPLLSDPPHVSHTLPPPVSHAAKPPKGDAPERMQLQFGQFDLGSSNGFTSSLPSQQHQQQAVGRFVPSTFNDDRAHMTQGAEAPSRDYSEPCHAASVSNSDSQAHRYAGPPVPAASIAPRQQERPPGSHAFQAAEAQQRPLQYSDTKHLPLPPQQQTQSRQRDAAPPQGPPHRSFSHTQQQQQPPPPPSQGQQQRPPPQRQQQQQQQHPPQQQPHAGSSMYSGGYNQHYGQQFGGAFAQPTSGYDAFGDGMNFGGSGGLDRHTPFTSGYSHGNVSSHVASASATKSAESQPSSYVPSAEKAPQEGGGGLVSAPSAASGNGPDAVATNHGQSGSLQGYGNSMAPGMGGYAYNSSGTPPAAYGGGGGHGTSGTSYGGGSTSGGGYGSMPHQSAAYPYSNYGNHHTGGYSQQPAGYGSAVQPGSAYGSSTVRAKQHAQQQYPGYHRQGVSYSSKDGREDVSYQQDRNPFAAYAEDRPRYPLANGSYELQGYSGYGGLQYQQGRQPHWQGGGSGGFGNSGYNSYDHPPQGGNQ